MGRRFPHLVEAFFLLMLAFLAGLVIISVIVMFATQETHVRQRSQPADRTAE